MDSSDKEPMKRLLSLSECCICINTYTDPRLLPCFHTACLKCFEDLQSKNQKKPGDVLPCPLCRKEFSIPAEGMAGLRKNFFIESLMEVTKTFNVNNNSVLCNICSIVEDESAINNATMRCLNCCENYCLRCSKMHKGQKLTRDHKIIEINSTLNEDEIRNMFPIRKCVRHSDKVLDYYCSDCMAVVCVSCFVEEHQTHKCKDVTTVDKEFRQRIEKSSRKLYDHRNDILWRKRLLQKQKIEFDAKALETESAIRKKSQELKNLIDQQTEELLNELSLLKQRQEKKMYAEIEEIERKLTVQENFVAYCTELKSKGSPSEVCGSTDSLLARANELREKNDEYLRAPSRPFEFEFIATDQSSFLQTFGNVIGEFSESTKDNGASNSFAVVIGRDSSLTTSIDIIIMSLNQPEDVAIIKPLPDEIQYGDGIAAAVYRNLIFVCGAGNKFEEIWRYDLTSSKWIKCASLVQGRQNHSVAFIDHALYICGGCLNSSQKALDDVEAYNTFGDCCSKIGKLAYASYSSGNCVPFKASLYIFGGFEDDTNAVRSVQVYDTMLNTCTLLTKQMPRACVWLHDILFKDSVMLISDDGCFLYNFNTQTWKVRDKFKLESSSSGVIVNDNKLFVIGCGSKKDEIRWIPVANVLNDEPIKSRLHSKLPNKCFEDAMFVFAIGKLKYPL